MVTANIKVRWEDSTLTSESWPAFTFIKAISPRQAREKKRENGKNSDEKYEFAKAGQRSWVLERPGQKFWRRSTRNIGLLSMASASGGWVVPQIWILVKLQSTYPGGQREVHYSTEIILPH